MTPDQITELKEKHGNDLHLLAHDGVEVVAKRPGKNEYRKFRRETMDEKRKENAAEGFVRSCVVSPGGAEVTAIFDQRPGLVDTLASALVDLAGAAKECESTPL
jgi:hypothetical protein